MILRRVRNWASGYGSCRRAECFNRSLYGTGSLCGEHTFEVYLKSAQQSADILKRWRSRQ